jgi:hypothetical protein
MKFSVCRLQVAQVELGYKFGPVAGAPVTQTATIKSCLELYRPESSRIGSYPAFRGPMESIELKKILPLRNPSSYEHCKQQTRFPWVWVATKSLLYSVPMLYYAGA